MNNKNLPLLSTRNKQIQIQSEPVVQIIDNQVRASSIDVAEFFGKRHDNVLRDIKNLIKKKPDFCLLNFEECGIIREIPLQDEKSMPYFRMTRDGFTLLAMGFTGDKAFNFKIAYIEAFNRMEAELVEQARSRQPKHDLASNDKNARAHAVTLRTLARNKSYPKERQALFLAEAASLLSGKPIEYYLPATIDNRHNWQPPTELAKQFGVSINMLGRTLKALGLHGEQDTNHQWSQPLWNKSPHSERQVLSYLYDPAVVIPKIEQHLRSKAYTEAMFS